MNRLSPPNKVANLLIILYFILTIQGINYCQTAIWTNAGNSYTNIDTDIEDNYSINVSDCSSIRFSMDFSFSLPWTGSPRMENSSICTAFGGCAGDPFMPNSGGCDNCWDFMYIELALDGIVIESELIGYIDEMRQSGSISWTVCTDAASTASIRIINQNWAADETNTFSNLQIECWEGYPEFDVSPSCENQSINLDGMAGNNNDIASWNWTTSGPGSIDNNSSQNTLITGALDGDMITLSTTDNNNCTSSVTSSFTVNPIDDASFDYLPFCIPLSSGPTNIVTSGGTFELDPDPNNGSIIDPVTGVISNAVPGTYEVKYVTIGQCPDTQIVSVVASALEDASFDFDDFCAGESNEPSNIVTSGGTFELDPIPGDGATIDPTTGEISGGVSGTTYTVRYTTSGTCPGTSTQDVAVMAIQSASFDFDDFCVGGSNGPTNISPSGGTFSFANPPGDGATIDPNTGIISNSTENTYDVLYTTMGSCPGTAEVNVEAIAGPTGTLSGNATLCPNQCETFSFDFTSGNEPYTINLTASPPGISLPAIPGVNASQVFTICYGGSGFIPSFDPSTFTVNIPTIFTGSGSLVLTGISDGSGCPGTASGSFMLTLTTAPTANTAGPLTACADIDGNGTFDLTSLNNTINGGNGSLSVEWFEDIDATIPINNPSVFISMGGTVYVRVNNGSCESATIPIVLTVETGNVPFISMVCAESGTDNCTICVTNGQFNLDFLFSDNNTYTATVRDDNTGLEYTGQVSNLIPLTVNSNVSTTFTLLNLQPLTGCPNNASYTDVVTITIVLAPEIDPITIAPSCQPIFLPSITGNHLSGNESYFTGPNGSGTPLIPGTQIFTSQTLYIFDENGGCQDEITVEIIITPLILFDDIMDMEDCVEIVLPSITGTGISNNTNFNTSPDGSGAIYLPGDILDASITLYVFDPDADPNCLGNSVSFEVTINGEPDPPTFTIVCTGTTATITITNLPDSDHSVSLNGGPFQTGDIFTNVPNGVYTLVIRNDITGCESTATSVSVNCGCDDPAILILSSLTDSICLDRPNVIFTLNNIVFSLPTTNVTITTNGAGTLSNTSFTSSPFSVSYTTSALDNGQIVDILFTTNDPDGNGPCGPTVQIFRLTILPKPNGIITGPSDVCIGGEVTLSASGGSLYIWNDGNTSPLRTFENITSDTSFTVTVTDENGCVDALTKNVVVKTATAGRDSLASFCISSTSNINLNDYLSREAASTGIWKNGNDTLLNFANFPVATLAIGTHILRYIINDTLCGRDTALLQIQIRESNNAGQDNSLTLCETESSADLTLLLGLHDIGGMWQRSPIDAPPINNQGVVDLTLINFGVYRYLYIIPENGCSSDTATIILDIKEYKNIGPFNAITRCIGSIVDLRDIIRETDLSGVLLNPNNHAGLVGSMWNTDTFTAGTYTFEYLITNEWPCPNEIDTLTIILQENLNPGNNITSFICDGQSVDLNSLLSADADSGGIFIYQGQEINGGLFTPTIGITNYTIQYQVGDGVSCPTQTAIITLEVETAPNVRFEPIVDICENDCQDIIINHSTPLGSILHFSVQNFDATFTENRSVENMDNGSTLSLTFCNGQNPLNFSNLPNGQVITLFLDSIVTPLGCSFSFEQNIAFNTLRLNKKEISPVICRNETFTLGNVVFDINNTTGDVVLLNTTQTGCDTLTTVNLNFYPEALGTFEATFCNTNESVTIGNEIFDFSRPSGSVLLTAASSNGCDSTVNVLLSFNPIVFSGSYLHTTCDADYIYIIGQDTFNYDNPDGMVLLPGQATGGCDSLVNVLIQYVDFDVEYTVEESCNNDPGLVILTTSSEDGPFTIKNNLNIVGMTPTLPYSISLPLGNYTLEVETNEGCRDTLALSVTSTNAPEVSLTQILNSDGSVQLLTSAVPNIIGDLSWTPTESLSCSGCLEPVANPSETTTYQLAYTYGNDCTDSRQITVNRQIGTIIFPNILAVNSLSNSSFYVTMPEGITGTVSIMRIYDRWGNMLFEKNNIKPNDPDEGWKGLFNGRQVANGVYIYYVEVLLDGQKEPDIYVNDITVLE